MDEQKIRFSEDHLWVVEKEGSILRVGLSDWAQEHLGELTRLETVEPGTFLESGDHLGEVEAQKTVVDLACPVTGTVMAVNETVVEDPSLVNIDPYEKGWVVEIEIDDADELDHLMTMEDYEEFAESQD